MITRSGFSMVETLVALTLSGVVLMLVSTTFLVQNRYYQSQREYAATHDAARALTERVAGELRSVMPGGIAVAGARTLTLRSPIVLMGVCEIQSPRVHLYNEGGETPLVTAEVGGIGWLDETTGLWTYREASWSYLNGGGGTAAANRCATNGADTAWAAPEFHRVENFQTLFGSLPQPGDVLMLFRGTRFQILESTLEPGRLALFRRVGAGPLVELVTGLDTTAKFQYRTGGTTYADTVVAASLGSVDAVRIVADARRPAPTGGAGALTFGWSVNIALRNAP